MKATCAATSWSELPDTLSPLARAAGAARIAFKRRAGETVLDTLYQQGCAKLRLPRLETGAWPCAVTLNTAGGLTGGDRLSLEARWGEATRATLAAQAAERIYRSPDGRAARVETRLVLDAGACGEWLPQETILFQGGRLDRDLAVEMAGDASFLGLEMLVFGRVAMGEVVTQGAFRDGWRIRRDGRLVYADALVLGDALVRDRLAPAGLREAGALATIIAVRPDGERLLEPIRALLADQPLAGASAWDGLLAVRLLTPDGAALRRLVVACLSVLRTPRALPRVWLC